VRTDVAGRLEFRLTFSDVDLVQFFFADYYRWMERALAELMDTCGYSRKASFAEGLGFPIVESGCRYLRPASVDERLVVVGRFTEMSTRSFRVGYRFERDGAELAEGFTQHVVVRLDRMESCPVPEVFRVAPASDGGAS
jgi:YbgC/YbaW family acyl-CoA thioester hydrolase